MFPLQCTVIDVRRHLLEGTEIRPLEAEVSQTRQTGAVYQEGRDRRQGGTYLLMAVTASHLLLVLRRSLLVNT